MNYGEIRASIYLALGDNAAKVTEFQLGEAIDMAQLWMVNTLPSELLPELINTEVDIDIDNSTGASNAGEFPADFVRELYLTDKTDGWTYRLMSKANFELHKSINTYDRIATVGAGEIKVSPLGTDLVVDLTYIKEPTLYVTIDGTSASYEGNISSPDFDSTLHQMLVDHATATVAQGVGDMNLYQAKMSNAFLALSGKNAQAKIGQ